MARLVTVHSFRRAAGRSTLVANLATLLGQQGLRVAMLDADLQAPGMHVLFGLADEAMGATFNGYLDGRYDIEQAAHDVSTQLGLPPGRVYLVPANAGVGEIVRASRQGFDLEVFEEGCRALIESLALDVLLIDSHAGLSEETLLTIALTDMLLIVLRPDQRDFEGTGVTVQVARKLEVPHIALVVNEVASLFRRASVQAQVEHTYGCPVAGILFHSDELLALSSGVFVAQYPDHALSEELRRITLWLLRP